jgi:ADP-heptose:LPS heptosyltransferase
MGLIKRMERRGKGALMRGLGGMLRARRMSAAEVRATPFESVLLVRQHHQMGDMMLAVPALRAIKETYPTARVGVVTSTINGAVLRNHPYVDRVFTYDKRDPLATPRLVRAIRRERFHLAIALHTVSFSFTTLMIAVLSGARVRVGSTSPDVGDLAGSYLNFTLPLPSPAELEAMNEAEHNLYPLRAIGIHTDDISPLMVPAPESERWAEGFAAECWTEGTVRLVVHPGAGKEENIWPPESFARVVDGVARLRPVSLAVVEGPRDAPAVAAFRAACGVSARVARARPIGDIAALLRRADLVVCNDTGVMHVAVAAGARTLAVFGPTDPARWAPRRDNLHVARAPDGRLASVTPERVVRKAAALLGLVALAEDDLEREGLVGLDGDL